MRSSIVRAFFHIAILVAVVSFWAAPLLAAEVDPNQFLAFKKLYVESAHDNVDGAFRSFVEKAYKDVFARNPRFELVKDRAAADSVLRTVLNKKTNGLDIAITLLADNVVFSEEKASLGTADENETHAALRSLLKATLKRIPFFGTVTGRDGRELTFDIGEAHGLRVGDIIQISRIDNIKRHPLLKSVIDAQMVLVGMAQIDQVEDAMAFGHVQEEIVGQKIERWQKVTAVEGRGTDVGKKSGKREGHEHEHEEDEEDIDRPQLGYVGLGIMASVFSSSTSIDSGATTYSGSSFNPGGSVFGELWLTKNWFAGLSFAGSLMTYSQKDTASSQANEGVSANTTDLQFDGGYRFLPNGTLQGPQISVKLGYRRFAWSVTGNSAQLLSGKAYSGINLGLGGQLPMRSSIWGLLLNVDVLLVPSLTEDNPRFVTSPSALGVNAGFGIYDFVTPTVALRAAFNFGIYSASNSGSSASTSQTQIGFVPSIVYYF